MWILEEDDYATMAFDTREDALKYILAAFICWGATEDDIIRLLNSYDRKGDFIGSCTGTGSTWECHWVPNDTAPIFKELNCFGKIERSDLYQAYFVLRFGEIVK